VDSSNSCRRASKYRADRIGDLEANVTATTTATTKVFGLHIERRNRLVSQTTLFETQKVPSILLPRGTVALLAILLR
jgi:hypothetical protein